MSTVMSEPTQLGTPSPPRGPRRWPWIIGIFVALIVGIGIGGAGSDSSTPAAVATPSATITEAAPAAEVVETEEAAPQYVEPTQDDFDLAVKTLTKECFGNAGCNVTFRVKLAYAGAGLDPDKTYEITYEVRGGEDPLVNTLEATGVDYSTDQEEMISTPSSHSKLRAVVTDVSEQ